MPCPFARFVIYYKKKVYICKKCGFRTYDLLKRCPNIVNGKTCADPDLKISSLFWIAHDNLVEDRNVPNHWKIALKYQCSCCGFEVATPPEVCPSCKRAFHQVSMIQGLGILFDPVPLWDKPWETEYGRIVPIMSRHKQTRVKKIAHRLEKEGVNTYNYAWFMDYVQHDVVKRRGSSAKTVGIRIGVIIDRYGTYSAMETDADRKVVSYVNNVDKDWMGRNYLNLSVHGIKHQTVCGGCGAEWKGTVENKCPECESLKLCREIPWIGSYIGE